MDVGWSKFERAIDLNPLAPDHYWWVGATIQLHQQEYARAIDMCSRMESDTNVLRILTASHALLGNISEARRYGSRMKELYPSMGPSSAGKIAPFKDNSFQKIMEKGLRLADV